MRSLCCSSCRLPSTARRATGTVTPPSPLAPSTTYEMVLTHHDVPPAPAEPFDGNSRVDAAFTVTASAVDDVEPPATATVTEVRTEGQWGQDTSCGTTPAGTFARKDWGHAAWRATRRGTPRDSRCRRARSSSRQAKASRSRTPRPRPTLTRGKEAVSDGDRARPDLSAADCCQNCCQTTRFRARESRPLGRLPRRHRCGGARRDRTADLLNAIQALSQLSYDPIPVVNRDEGEFLSPLAFAFNPYFRVSAPASRRTLCRLALRPRRPAFESRRASLRGLRTRGAAARRAWHRRSRLRRSA